MERWIASATRDWPFFEMYLAYDSPRLAQGALDGAKWTPELGEAGLAALAWLARVQTSRGGHFRPPGSDSYGQPGVMAGSSQQPLDAWAQVEATLAAATLTGSAHWLSEARRAHAWFVGENDAKIPLATAEGGCRDGIDPQGVSVDKERN